MKILMWMGGSFDRRTPSEHLLTAIIQALYDNNHTVHIIQKDTGGPLPCLPRNLEDLGVTMDCVPCKMVSKSNFVARYLMDFKYVLQCRKIIRKHRDCEAVFNQSSNVAGIMAYIIKHTLPDARLTYNVQDIFPENAAFMGSVKGIVYKILSVEQRYAYRHVDQIITISKDMMELLVEKGADPKKIELIYNWSYTDKLYNKEEIYSKKIKGFLAENKFNVVYAGNIGLMQNVGIVVNVAKIMQKETDIHFHIFGDGIYKERLQKEAENLNNISFWPMQQSELAPSIYAMADVNIIPLAQNIFRVALPSKIATCIACQKPIIFCFGRDSRFGQWMEREEGFYVTDCHNERKIAEIIRNIKKSGATTNNEFMFSEFFSRRKNSNRYAELIVGENKKE